MSRVAFYLVVVYQHSPAVIYIKTTPHTHKPRIGGDILEELVTLDNSPRSLEYVQTATAAVSAAAGGVVLHDVIGDERAGQRGLAHVNASAIATIIHACHVGLDRGIQQVQAGVPGVDAAAGVEVTCGHISSMARIGVYPGFFRLGGEPFQPGQHCLVSR